MSEEKYIYVNSKKIYVSDEVYKEYKKLKNREEYLARLDRKHKEFHFGGEILSVEDLEDKSVNIEKIIETKLRIEDLYNALDNLNEEERRIINALYFEDKTIRDVAKEQEISAKKIFTSRNKILQKLKKTIEGEE
ncbi:MAG: sigma factor-like helix-turn-helix DNA-binding protein [Peptostreptococcus sp.]|uniref:RNA polymerase sigma factor n=1 Tax=Peptostreptococcus sp. TaxID=1262 RepID=UPI0007643757|nr:sigma factor-like helix-turn-helix DNA-binding protein [Peptostreptococcus sp.]KWZ94683.1 sigma-70, region 4 [Anaerococcus hydrogenalis]MDU5350759.1 sigma factor-like helix-turn-helix DNA-binding protein [Peptostreptococcus sp.]MDU5890379.1 sigma factor-like helix-turn-helix DNA-binding protein [Peptostreptococcus sp.]HES4526391.1 sigma-70 family RNA polymerase sigma factor [Streptococcus pyogenes]